MYPIGFWRSQQESTIGIFQHLDNSITNLLRRSPDALPDLRRATTIIVASDYSGEHRGSSHQVLSFLVANLADCGVWDKQRQELRQNFLSDGRRMSFKNLRDKQRWDALVPFLSAANTIPGLLFTVAISSKIDSLFTGPVPLDLSNPDFAAFRAWSRPTLEKAFRVVHFLSFLLAGLLRDGQDVLWFTDDDAIAANPDRLASLTNLVAWVSSSYLTFSLGHLRCGTTRSDDGSRRIEDLAAVPDVVAGAISEQLSLEQADPGVPPGNAFWLYRGEFSSKTSSITWWLCATEHPLKRLFVRLDPKNGGTQISSFHFHDQT
jgi:hypothetical protein